MQDDSFQITGYGSNDDPELGRTRPTVQFDYQINGQVYSTEHFLDVYGDPMTLSADSLQKALSNWVINQAKPQLVPPPPVVSADLEALVE